MTPTEEIERELAEGPLAILPKNCCQPVGEGCYYLLSPEAKDALVPAVAAYIAEREKGDEHRFCPWEDCDQQAGAAYCVAHFELEAREFVKHGACEVCMAERDALRTIIDQHDEAHLVCDALREQLADAQNRIENMRLDAGVLNDALAERGALVARLKLEAQVHAQEARTANATIAEIYQLVTGATGEPGSWHGAEPVRAALAERDALRAEVEKLRAKVEIATLGPCHHPSVYTKSGCSLCRDIAEMERAFLGEREKGEP